MNLRGRVFWVVPIFVFLVPSLSRKTICILFFDSGPCSLLASVPLRTCHRSSFRTQPNSRTLLQLCTIIIEELAKKPPLHKIRIWFDIQLEIQEMKLCDFNVFRLLVSQVYRLTIHVDAQKRGLLHEMRTLQMSSMHLIKAESRACSLGGLAQFTPCVKVSKKTFKAI